MKSVNYSCQKQNFLHVDNVLHMTTLLYFNAMCGQE